MLNIKLDFDGQSLKELRQTQETLIQIISQLKHGLYNYEAAQGLNSSLELLMEMYEQTRYHYNKLIEQLPTVEIDHALNSN